MAKKAAKNPEHYEYVRAIRDGEDLRFEYKLNGAKVAGSEEHDEDVSEWNNAEIVRLAKQLLSIEDDDPVTVEVMERLNGRSLLWKLFSGIVLGTMSKRFQREDFGGHDTYPVIAAGIAYRTDGITLPDALPPHCAALAEAASDLWWSVRLLCLYLTNPDEADLLRQKAFYLNELLNRVSVASRPAAKDLLKVSSGNWGRAGKCAVDALYWYSQRVLAAALDCPYHETETGRMIPRPKVNPDHSLEGVRKRLLACRIPDHLAALKHGVTLELIRLSGRVHGRQPVWFVVASRAGRLSSTYKRTTSRRRKS